MQREDIVKEYIELNLLDRYYSGEPYIKYPSIPELLMLKYLIEIELRNKENII